MNYLYSIFKFSNYLKLSNFFSFFKSFIAKTFIISNFLIDLKIILTNQNLLDIFVLF